MTAEKETYRHPCRFCNNARVARDPDLNDNNDLSFYPTAGSFANPGYRMIIGAGGGKPVRLLFENLDGRRGWLPCVEYRPRFCPECGRRLDEYEKGKGAI